MVSLNGQKNEVSSRLLGTDRKSVSELLDIAKFNYRFVGSRCHSNYGSIRFIVRIRKRIKCVGWR